MNRKQENEYYEKRKRALKSEKKISSDELSKEVDAFQSYNDELIDSLYAAIEEIDYERYKRLSGNELANKSFIIYHYSLHTIFSKTRLDIKSIFPLTFTKFSSYKARRTNVILELMDSPWIENHREATSSYIDSVCYFLRNLAKDRGLIIDTNSFIELETVMNFKDDFMSSECINNGYESSYSTKNILNTVLMNHPVVLNMLLKEKLLNISDKVIENHIYEVLFNKTYLHESTNRFSSTAKASDYINLLASFILSLDRVSSDEKLRIKKRILEEKSTDIYYSSRNEKLISNIQIRDSFDRLRM